MKKLAIISLVFTFSIGLAQETDTTNKKSDYKLAGPNQVDNQLSEDKQDSQRKKGGNFMQSFDNFKSNLKTKSGFDFGIDYSSVYFSATESLGDKSSAAGMVRLYGSWELVNRGKKNNGAFIYKVEHRHKFTDITPKNFGFEMGYVGMQVPAFNEDGFRMTNFYWRQRLFDGKLSFVAGLLDATDYVDVYALASPWTGFMNFQFSTGSQTVYIPNDAALGLAVGAYLSDRIYTIASISDAGSDPTAPFKSFETFFSNNDYFKSVEIGLVSSKERFFLDNVHLTYWHSDGSAVTASLPGWGVAFSATHHFKNNLHPFIRGGYAEDGGTLLQKSLVIGTGYTTPKRQNTIGLSLGWGEVNETTFASGLDNQITAELFYKMQVSKRIVFTPDVQYLVNPATNPNTSSIFLWGIRGRIAI